MLDATQTCASASPRSAHVEAQRASASVSSMWFRAHGPGHHEGAPTAGPPAVTVTAAAGTDLLMLDFAGDVLEKNVVAQRTATRLFRLNKNAALTACVARWLS